ncbi:MAG: ribonuclease III family protein [Candidatus Hodarchaeota archaeon]
MVDFSQIYEKFHKLNKIPYLIPTNLFLQAFTHPTYKNIDKKSLDFEKLETIGDAVLDLVVITWLYENGAECPLQLTNARSLTVDNKNLSILGKEMKLHNFLRTAPSYEIQAKDLANAVEALIGAYYIAYGFKKCNDWVITILKDFLQNALEEVRRRPLRWGQGEQNPINLLQEFFQQQHLSIPSPKQIKVEGKDHKKIFTIEYEVSYKGLTYKSQGRGKRKKSATKAAAMNLCKQLGIINNK